MEKLSHIIDQSEKIKEPGFCVKTNCEKEKIKFFINFCHSSSISPPTVQLDENDLKHLIESENYEELSRFTIPLVLEQLETTTDKKGSQAKLTHAVINTKFFKTCISVSEIYKNFLIYVTMEIINAKFDFKLNYSSFVILRNKLFQLPDKRSTFYRLITSYIPSNYMANTCSDKASHQMTDDNASITISTSNASKTTTVENFCDNVILASLDVENQIVEIKIKFHGDCVTRKHLSLMLNDDHVVVKNGESHVCDFYLSIFLQHELAKAYFKNNSLFIQCPVVK